MAMGTWWFQLFAISNSLMRLAVHETLCALMHTASHCISPTWHNRTSTTNTSRLMTWEDLCSGSRIPIARSRCFLFSQSHKLAQMPPSTIVLPPLQASTITSGGRTTSTWPPISMRRLAPISQPAHVHTRVFCIILPKGSSLKKTCSSSVYLDMGDQKPSRKSKSKRW